MMRPTMIRSANPALNKSTFEGLPSVVSGDTMTIESTAAKTGILLVIALLPACWVWRLFMISGPAAVRAPLMAGAILGLIAAIITIFKKTAAPITAPIYAACEGLVIGGISSIFEAKFPGIILQAVGATFGSLFVLLTLYRTGWVKVTENFRLGIFSATGAIALIYLVSFVLSFFGIRVPYIHESGLVGIFWSLFVVTIAALNLVLDFDFIERGAEQGAPKYMEWYAAFGLIVTLVWLYIELLHLLAKLRDRR